MKKDISIADLLLWVYGAQKAHLVLDQGRGLLPDERRADGREVQGVSGCGVQRCMDNAVLGVEIDYFGPDRGSLHVDAEEVHDLVRGSAILSMFDYAQVGQIIHYGQTGVCPDWMPGAVPVLRGRRDGKGRPVMLYPLPEDKRRRRLAYACELEVVMSAAQIDLARDVYYWWFEAMDMLKIYYQTNPMSLKDFSVVSVGVEAEPWQKEFDKCILI